MHIYIYITQKTDRAVLFHHFGKVSLFYLFGDCYAVTSCEAPNWSLQIAFSWIFWDLPQGPQQITAIARMREENEPCSAGSSRRRLCKLIQMPKKQPTHHLSQPKKINDVSIVFRATKQNPCDMFFFVFLIARRPSFTTCIAAEKITKTTASFTGITWEHHQNIGDGRSSTQKFLA